MANLVSEIDINKISSLVYIGVKDKKINEIAIAERKVAKKEP